MTKSYEILTKCQSELMNCEIKEIDKLHLEMCIIRTKILLLENGKMARYSSSTESETEFKDLYEQICNLCGPEGDVNEVGIVIDRLQKLIEEMKRST